MKRFHILIFVTLATAVAGCFLWPVAAYLIVRPSVPGPHSAVPITCELGFWPNQDGLAVTELTAEAVDPKLNLFNNRFLIRYHLKGTITFRSGWRPRITKAQVTARRSEQNASVADVSVVPVVEVNQDKQYSQQSIPFDLTLEQIMETMDWGSNRYEIHCSNQTAVVSVHQRK